MRRFMLLATLCSALVLALTPAVMAQSRGPSGADGTYNCEDFDDQGQAQEFSLGDPGDTNGLDEDGDGIVCESLPTAAPSGNNDTVLIPGVGESTSTGTQYEQYEQPIAEAVDEDTSSTTTTTPLPDTGGLPLMPLAGALVLGLGALGLASRSRIS